MTTFRSLLAILLMVLLLPWGAYASASAQGIGDAFLVAQPVLSTSTAMQKADPIRVAEATPPRHCRRASLPGSSCGSDLLAAPATALPPLGDGATTFAAPRGWQAKGHAPSPPRDPPRPI
jgi:hypothetical protein